MIKTNQTYNQNLRSVANELLYRFEAKYFHYDGCYPYQLSLILAFDEYIRRFSDEDIAEILNGKGAKVTDFRAMIDNGIEAWLNQSELKTLALR